jgi:Domain of unknown function (DUF4861)
MKKLLLILLIIPLFCVAKPANTITVQNPSENSLNEYCVVVEKAKLKQNDNAFYPVLKDQRSGKIIASQLDDMDADGNWDELAFLVSLAGKEKYTADIEWVVKNDYPDFPARTNIYFGISRERNGEFIEATEEVLPPKYECNTPYQYQFEGVGWENDKIGFRTYCDMRNGKDIFGKTGKDMVLHSVGKEDNYHDTGDWGMDVLKVGSSLGIGAIAVIDDGVLYRLGDTEYHDFKIVTEGPVRSVFELNFEGWEVNGNLLSAKETISISAARNGFKNRVKVWGENCPDTLVSGLSMVGNDGQPGTIEFKAAHGISLAGVNDVDDEFLGMSVLIAKNKKFEAAVSKTTDEVYDTSTPEYKGTKYHPIITDTYYMASPGKKAEFIVHSMWGVRYPCIKTAEDYRTMLEEDALHYFTKLRVKIK